MSLTSYERGSTWRSYVFYQSGSTPLNCSGNKAYLTVYKPDDTILIGPVSGHHVSSGTYEYFVSTQSTDDLGIYITKWKAWFDYQTPWNYSPKVDREAVHIVHVK